MSVNKYNAQTGKLERIAGGTVYADAPIGAIVSYGGTEAPRGWLLCDGSAVSRTTYSELFAKIGTAYGAGDGSTTFNVPDLRGHTTAGYNEGDALYGTLGDSIGEDTHTLTVDEMPSHTHIATNYLGAAGWQGTSPSYGYLRNDAAGGYLRGNNPETKATGGNGAHNNIQPTVIVNYIIKSENILVPHDFAEYVANQNVLSDYESVTLPFTAEYDGCVIVNTPRNNGFTLLVDSQAIAEAVYSSNYPNSSSCMIRKGQVVTVNNLVAYSSAFVAYYKLRDYTGR